MRSRAAAFAARLAGELPGAQVTLVTVGHIPSAALAGPAAGTMIDLGALETSLERTGATILAETRKQFGGRCAGDPSRTGRAIRRPRSSERPPRPRWT